MLHKFGISRGTWLVSQGERPGEKAGRRRGIAARATVGEPSVKRETGVRPQRGGTVAMSKWQWW